MYCLRFFSPLLFVLALASCSKDQDDSSKPPTAAPTSKGAAESTAAGAKIPANDAADFIVVEAMHAPAKPADPVVVRFETFRIVSASFDPANLEGASAEIALDMSSISSGSKGRDKSLRSDEYLDIESFATATIKVAEVVKADDRYAAQATVSFRGVDKTYPVRFEVVESTDRKVVVSAEHRFLRSDFRIGKEQGDSAEQELVIKMRLTFEK